MFSVQKDRYFPLTVCLPRIAKKQVYFCIDEQFYNGIPDNCYVISVSGLPHSSGNVCCCIKERRGWVLGVRQKNRQVRTDIRLNILDKNTGTLAKWLINTTVSIKVSLHRKCKGIVEKIVEAVVEIELASKLPRQKGVSVHLRTEKALNEDVEMKESQSSSEELWHQTTSSSPPPFFTSSIPFSFGPPEEVAHNPFLPAPYSPPLETLFEDVDF